MNRNRLVSVALDNEYALAIRIVIDKGGISKWQVKVPHIAKSRRIPPDNYIIGNAMASFAHAPGDPGEGDVGRGQPKEYKGNSIICRSASPQPGYVPSAGTGRFKSEAVASADEFIQALDH